MTSLTTRIDSVVKNIHFNDSIEENLFKERLIKFINNDSDEQNQIKLLKVVNNIKWYRTPEITAYIISEASHQIDEYSIVYQFKEKIESSNTYFISSISYEGIITEEQIMGEEDILFTGIPRHIQKIVLIDDYLGSGETIIKAIKRVLPIVKNRKIVVISCLCQKSASIAINLFKTRNKLDVVIKYKVLLNSFREYLDYDTSSLVEEICSNCKNPQLINGWGGVGAMVSINTISPNNNIPIIWYDDISWDGSIQWFPLLNRSYNIKRFSQRTKSLIKKEKVFLIYYYKEKLNKSVLNITYDEFEFLIYSYNCYYTKEELVYNNYFESVEELNTFLLNMLSNEIIEIKNNSIRIINSNALLEIKKVFKELQEKNKKYKKGTTNTIDK